MYAGSMHERMKRAQISATIYCLRMGFWLVSCADAMWEGLSLIWFEGRSICRVKDRDSLVS